MTHAGWFSPATAEYYLKLANVIKACAPADLLAQGSTAVTEAVDLYSTYNSLEEFIIAFPSLAPSSRKRPLSYFFPRKGRRFRLGRTHVICLCFAGLSLGYN